MASNFSNTDTIANNIGTNLLEELKSVSNWQTLLIELGLEVHKIDTIKKSHVGNVDLQKKEAFDQWLQEKCNASWEDVIEALFKINEIDLARILTRKYNWRDPRVSADKLNLISAPTVARLTAKPVSDGSPCLKLLPDLSDDEKYYTLHAPTLSSYTNPAKLLAGKIHRLPQKGHNLCDYLRSIEKSDFKFDFKVGLEVRFGTVYWKLKPNSILKEGSTKIQWDESKLLRRTAFNPEVQESDLIKLLKDKKQSGNGVQISLTIKFTFANEGVYSVSISTGKNNDFIFDGVYREAHSENLKVKINIAIPDRKYDMKISDCSKCMVSEETNHSTPYKIAETIVNSLHRKPNGKLRLILQGNTEFKGQKCSWEIKFIRQRTEILYIWKPEKRWKLACYDVDVFDPEKNETVKVNDAPLDEAVDIPEFDYSRKEIEFWGQHYYPNEANRTHSSEEIHKEGDYIKQPGGEVRPSYNWTTEDLMRDFEEFLGDAFQIAHILDGSQ